MLLIHHKRVSLTRPVFNPLTLALSPTLRAVERGWIGMAYENGFMIYFSKMRVKNGRLNLKPTVFV